MNTPTNLIYAQGNLTEFKTIFGTINYEYPIHSMDGSGMFALEKWIDYRFPFVKPIPIQIVTNGFDALGNVNRITTDSFF